MFDLVFIGLGTLVPWLGTHTFFECSFWNMFMLALYRIKAGMDDIVYGLKR